MRPNGKVWLGDVGFTNWEEIDTIPDARRGAAQLRLAVPGGQRRHAAVRRPGHPALHQPAGARRPGLHVQPRRHRHQRRLRDRQLVDLGHRLPHDRGQLPEQVRQRPVLRRLHAPLHLVRPGLERDREPGLHVDRAVRQPAPVERHQRRRGLRRRDSGRRRHLRRLRPPGDPGDPLQRRAAAQRRVHRDPHVRPGSARRRLRRQRVQRPERRPHDVRLGLEQRRRVRRQRRDPIAHVHDPRQRHGPPAGDRGRRVTTPPPGSSTWGTRHPRRRSPPRRPR